MANTIGWAQIYCPSWWGVEENKLSVPEFPEYCALIPADCGTQYGYSGGATFPERYEVNFSGATGTSTLTFDAQSYPDKWIIVQGGTVLLDTGYRGSTLFQDALNDALAERGLPPETIAGTGSGSANFTVSGTEPVYVYVYAPVGNTVYTFTVGCPV